MAPQPIDRPWHGTLLVAPGRALYVGPAGDTRPHRHHAVQLVVALEGEFEAQLGGLDPRRFEALLVAADFEHRIDGQGLPLAIYYADDSSQEGRALGDRLGEHGALSLPAELQDLRRMFESALSRSRPAVLAFLRGRLGEILRCDRAASSAGDPAIEAAIALLGDSLSRPLSVPELAERVGLSQRQLSAGFRSQTGLSIRRYVLWLRLNAAVSALAERRTLTDAAHSAGFADGAHLSRTFVQMFGVAPSASVAVSDLEVVAS